MSRIAYTGARIFDGEMWWERSALVVNGDRIEGIIAADSPTDAKRVPLGGGILAPGFIDLQVNGAGGVLLNDTPDVAAIETICKTLMQFGTTACLPTLITDTREKNAAVVAAGEAAAKKGVRGFLGLHLEGPHLSVARKGAYGRGVPAVPATLTRLRAGDRLRVGDRDWIVIGGSGHTAEPVSLHRPADAAGPDLLISGDQILPRISPNISVWPTEPDADPLADYLASLEGWNVLPADTLVLPSHGRPFHGLHRRAGDLARHHAERLAEIEALCAEPRTAAAVTRALFPRPLDPQQMLFAVGEAVAHLNHLIRKGRLERLAGRHDGVPAADLYRRPDVTGPA